MHNIKQFTQEPKKFEFTYDYTSTKIDEDIMEANITVEDIEYYLTNPLNEGVIGRLIGGLTGFALGKKIGGILARTLGLKQGILYDLLTSRLVGAALGQAIGKGL